MGTPKNLFTDFVIANGKTVVDANILSGFWSEFAFAVNLVSSSTAIGIDTLSFFSYCCLPDKRYSFEKPQN